MDKIAGACLLVVGLGVFMLADNGGWNPGRPVKDWTDIIDGVEIRHRLGGRLIPRSELRKAIIDAGATGDLVEWFVDRAFRESGRWSEAWATSVKEDSRGPWQVNIKAWPMFAGVNLADVNESARAAMYVYRNGGKRHWRGSN